MDQEPINPLPWEQVEQLLQTKNWDDLSQEQQSFVKPYFSELEYREARHLLLQTSELFKAERNLPLKSKPRWARLPYGIVAAAALALLISLGYLVLPEQNKSMAYSKTEMVDEAQPEQQETKLPLHVQHETAPKLGNQSTLSRQESDSPDLTTAEASKFQVEVVSENDEELQNRVGQVKASSQSAGYKPEFPIPQASGAIPMVRDSIWKNDTLWLLIKTPQGKDSLLPAMNSKGKVWTRN